MINLKQVQSLPELVRLMKEEGIPEDRFSDYYDIYMEYRARDKRCPLKGQFELTPLCNLNCKMCYVHLAPSQMQGKQLLSTEQWKDIIAQAVKAGMITANLTGGECLTYPGFEEIYRYLYELGVQVSINTNGVLLTDELIGMFSKYPPRNIQITLYGSSEESYERVTGSRVFGKVCENALKLKEASLRVSFSMTPSSYMLDGPEIVEQTFKLDIRTDINGFLIEPNCDTGRTVKDHDCSTDGYAACFEKLAELRGKHLKPVPEEELPPVGSDTGEREKGIPCAAGRSRFQIDWKGVMHACVNAQSMQAYPLEVGFDEAWKQVVAMADDYEIPAECTKCAYSAPCWLCPDIHLDSGRKGHCNPEACRRIRDLTRRGIVIL